MARRVFFSFHYGRDIWRVNQIRAIPKVIGSAAAGFQDASLWEQTKRKGDAAIKTLIDNGLRNTSVTVVCIGAATAGRKYINYEITQSIARRNGVIGVKIHHLKDCDGGTDPEGETPYKLLANGYRVRKYTNVHDLGEWIEAAALAAGK